MKVGSERLKSAVTKAVKGCGFNRLIPLTNLIGIRLSDGNLKFYTTDMSNLLTITIDKVSGDDFNIMVEADRFAKLVNKMTSNEIDLTVNDDILVIKGNGTYKLPLSIDEEMNGGAVVQSVVEFPVDESEYAVMGEVQLTSIMSAYNINRAALAKTFEQPALIGYYCGDNVVTSDAIVITFNRFKMFKDQEDMLISPQMMQLLTLNSSEKIEFGKSGNNLVFCGDGVEIRGPQLFGIEEYPIDEINAYLDIAFESVCKIPKELMLDVLDRLSLFITPFDKDGAYFTFGRTGITVHSKKDASTETINYIESKNFKGFTCLVDIVMMKEQLQACPEDTVTMWYGNENALKLETGNVVQVIALLEDDE